MHSEEIAEKVIFLSDHSTVYMCMLQFTDKSAVKDG